MEQSGMTVLGRTFAARPRPDNRPRLAADVRHGLGLSLVVFAVSRLMTFIVALAIAVVSGRLVTDVLARWDGGWYLAVVEHGYPDTVAGGVGAQAQTTLAFSPATRSSSRRDRR
jgi:hypothetical protein